MTAPQLPRWFRIVFVAVMLALCLAVVTQVPHQEEMQRLIVQRTDEIDVSRQRLRKQEMELAAARDALPAAQAELAVLAPQADAVYQREQELRARRKELRAQAKELDSQLADLTVRAQEDPVVRQADEALSALADLLDQVDETLAALR